MKTVKVVGWGFGLITFFRLTTHTPCYAAVRSHGLLHMRHATLLYVFNGLLHIRHATLLCVLWDFYIYAMLRCCTFSCASTNTPCYAAVRFYGLLHIRHAMLQYVLMHFYTYPMLRCCTFSLTWPRLHERLQKWGGKRRRALKKLCPVKNNRMLKCIFKIPVIFKVQL